MIARVFLSALVLQAALPAAEVSHSWREGALDLNFDDGSARLEWVSPVAFRVFRRWGSGTLNHSQINHDPVLVALEDAGPVLRMTTRYLTVEVSKANPNIQVRNGSSPVASISLERAGQDIEVLFAPMDHVYGLGGGGSPTLDLHGKMVERANGFLYTSNGYGVYTPSPQPVIYDLAKGSAQARKADQIEFAFYYGASPKEILEQHLTVSGQTEVTIDSLPLLRPERLPKEATKLAVDIANIRRIEVAIDVEISRASVQLPSHGIGELSQRIQIISCEKRHAIVECQALSGPHLSTDFVQFGIV